MINIEYHLDGEKIDVTPEEFIIKLRLPLSFNLNEITDVEFLEANVKKCGYMKFSLNSQMEIKYKIYFTDKQNKIFDKIKKASHS